jgi:hypothetical protein
MFERWINYNGVAGQIENMEKLRNDVIITLKTAVVNRIGKSGSALEAEIGELTFDTNWHRRDWWDSFRGSS